MYPTGALFTDCIAAATFVAALWTRGIFLLIPDANIFIKFGAHSSELLAGPSSVGDENPRKLLTFAATFFAAETTALIREVIPFANIETRFLPQDSA